MLFKHNPFSLLRDFKNFRNITADRQAKFDAAPNTPIEADFGANKLAKSLHPASLKVEIQEIEKTENGTYLAVKSDVLPTFKSGQYVNVSVENHPVPFFIISDPADTGEYRLFSTEAELNIPEKGEISIGGPMGSLSYLPLRDRKKVLFVCEEKYSPVASAFAEFSGAELRIEYGLNVKTESDESVFALGCTDFCDELKKVHPKIFIRSLNTDFQSPVCEIKEYKITLTPCDGTDKIITCKADETIAHALENAGITRLDKCLEGECGFCRMTMLSGEVTHVGTQVLMAEGRYGVIHPCRAFPKSDITLEYRGK